MTQRPRYRGLIALLALGAMGCRQRPPPPTTPLADVVADAGAPTVAVTARAAETASPLLDLAGETATAMARIRGLSLEHEVRRGVMSRDAIIARLRQKTAREYPTGEIVLEGELYKRLGLLPEAMDYERTMFELLEEQVAGFYDPDEQTLYIAEWLPATAQPVTMAHEITHALQDQHFHIGRYTHHVRGNGDAQTAAMAVIEGDAGVGRRPRGVVGSAGDNARGGRWRCDPRDKRSAQRRTALDGGARSGCGRPGAGRGPRGRGDGADVAPREPTGGGRGGRAAPSPNVTA